ncbi:MAG: hypothetical protein IT162_20520 [Bryobacterales bacterium]|nr:hypothetical protein [Bryobacterales bacterium]
MADELTPNDLAALWREQPRQEAAPMTAGEVRKMAQAFERRIWRRNAREYAGGAVGLAAYSFYLVKAPDWWLKAGALTVLAGVALVCWRIYRHGAAADIPADLALHDGLQFHRRRLEHQRDLLRGVWTWYLLPLVPGLAIILAALGRNPRVRWAAVATGLLAAAVFWGIGRLNLRTAEKLQREMDRLDELSKETNHDA